MRAPVAFLAVLALTAAISPALAQSIKPAPGSGGSGGSGTVTSVGTSTCLIGGPITTSGTLSVACASTDVIAWNADTGLSRVGADFLLVGNGIQGDASATLGAGAYTIGQGLGGQWNSTALAFNSTGILGWTATGNATVTRDTGLSRDSAGVIDVGNGAAGDISGTVRATAIRVAGLTASTDVCADASKNLITCTSTGTGLNVQQTSPTLITPALGTPTALVLTNATGLPLGGLATQATDTVVGNFSGSTASPVAFAMTTCSTAAKAVKYTTGTGFGCNSAIQATALSPVGVGISATLITVTAGGIFGTGPTIVTNGTFSGQITVGTSPAATAGAIVLPAATTGWHCSMDDETTLTEVIHQTAHTTTGASFIAYAITTGTATAPTAADKITYTCSGY